MLKYSSLDGIILFNRERFHYYLDGLYYHYISVGISTYCRCSSFLGSGSLDKVKALSISFMECSRNIRVMLDQVQI